MLELSSSHFLVRTQIPFSIHPDFLSAYLEEDQVLTQFTKEGEIYRFMLVEPSILISFKLVESLWSNNVHDFNNKKVCTL